MTDHFQYTGADLECRIVDGIIAADDEKQAREKLQTKGLSRIRLRTSDRPLQGADADEFAGAIAEAVESEMPLAAALKAAAMETENNKIRDALSRLATAIEDGNTLESALVRLENIVPPHLAALLSASVRTGAIAHVIPEIIEQRRTTRQMWREVLLMVGYPMVMLFVSMLLLSMFGIFVVAPFKQMFQDFQLELPQMTLLLIWWHNVGSWALLSAVLLLATAVLFGPIILSASRRRRILAWAPIVGPIVHWTSVSEMASLIALMIESGVELPDAVRFTGMSVEDVEIQIACRGMSESVEAGMLLSDAMQAAHVLPPTIVPMVQLGEREGRLPHALRSYAQSIAHRVRARGHLARLLLPTLIMAVVGLFIVVSIISLFLPLISLISGLS